MILYSKIQKKLFNQMALKIFQNKLPIKEVKKRKRRRRIFRKENVTLEYVDVITKRNNSIKDEEPNKNIKELTGEKIKREAEEKKGESEKEKSSNMDFGLYNKVDSNIRVSKIGSGLDILGPKMQFPFFDINQTIIDEGANIPEPKNGLPNIDTYIKLPKTGGGLTIKESKSELSNLGFKSNVPKISRVLDIHGPKSRSLFSVIKGAKIRLSNDDLDITALKIGGGLDINSPKIELPNIDMNRNAPKNEDINDSFFHSLDFNEELFHNFNNIFDT